MSAPTRSDLARMLTAARSATRPRQVARASRVALIAFVTAVAATALSAHEIHIFPHASPARTFLGTVDDRVSSRRISLNDAELHMRGIKSGAMAAALVTAVASGQNLLTNVGFEIGPDQACGWICVGVGSTQIPGWTVTLNSVDRQRTAPDGAAVRGDLTISGDKCGACAEPLCVECVNGWIGTPNNGTRAMRCPQLIKATKHTKDRYAKQTPN